MSAQYIQATQYPHMAARKTGKAAKRIRLQIKNLAPSEKISTIPYQVRLSLARWNLTCSDSNFYDASRSPPCWIYQRTFGKYVFGFKMLCSFTPLLFLWDEMCQPHNETSRCLHCVLSQIHAYTRTPVFLSTPALLHYLYVISKRLCCIPFRCGLLYCYLFCLLALRQSLPIAKPARFQIGSWLTISL